PFSSTSIRANRFRITIRDLTADQVQAASLALEEVKCDGIANYFDDQRFGSVSRSRDFVARQLILGENEAALKLALAEPYEHDRAAAKREKAALRDHWGDWKTCKQKLARGHTRSLIDYLVSHPTDFRGAFARMRQDLASLYIAAYQSHLWNRLLASWLNRNLPRQNLVDLNLKWGTVPSPRGLTTEQRIELARMSLPLPSARLDYAETLPCAPTDWPEVLQPIMADEEFALSQMKLKGLRRPFFSKGMRSILFVPQDLEMTTDQDERNSG